MYVYMYVCNVNNEAAFKPDFFRRLGRSFRLDLNLAKQEFCGRRWLIKFAAG